MTKSFYNFILGGEDGKTPMICGDPLEWAAQFEKGNRRVAEDEVNGVRVSTVFLGIDHNYGEGRPLLFETMIFGGEHDQYQDRYSTWKEAEAGHKEALKMIQT